MSRQIQIRRGSAAEHATFTGAVGEITMDTTNKTLRVHDGETAGGTILAKRSEIPEIANADYVVASQLPTSENNYTWYRKYKSGWVEQGGIKKLISNNSNYSQALPIEMSDTNYTVTIAQCATADSDYSSFYHNQGCVLSRTTTTVTLSNRRFNGTDTYTIDIMWQVSGLSAE